MSFLSAAQLVAANLALAAGAAVQGAVGFGLSLVAVPLLVLIDPRLVPGPVLCTAIALTLLLSLRERESIDFHGVAWGVAGRIPGSAIGAAALIVIAQEKLSLLFGVLVLVAVLLSALPIRIRPTRSRLLGVGVLSGFMGTTAAVGGPPIALLLQHEPGDRLRATLSGFFLLGASVSLSALAIIGRFGRAELLVSLTLLPGILLGFWISGRMARILDRGYTRVAVLATAALAALAAVLRQLL